MKEMKEMKKTIYFHEDDYGQIEVLPKENLFHCKSQMGLIEDFSNEHRVGIGFSKIYVREENPISLTDLNINVKSFEAIVVQSLTKYDEVLTGYSSYREKCENTCALELGEYAHLYYSFEAEIITNIWLVLNEFTEDHLQATLQVLQSISQLAELILVDWSWGEVIQLTNQTDLNKYLIEIMRLENE